MNLSKKQQLKYIKKSQTDRKTLSKICLKLWAEYVKIRAKYACEYCGKKENLNSHHFFSRSRNSVRYNVNNGICLCSGCHSLNNHSAHKNPLFKDELIKRKIRTQQWLDLLERQANIPQKIDLKLEMIYLEQELKNYVKD